MARSTISSQERWARFRFTVVRPLLSTPPGSGALRRRLKQLSQMPWRHPIQDGVWVRFGLSTIERWYYTAQKTSNPIEALRRTVRKDAGAFRSVSDDLAAAIRTQHREKPHWTYRLHYDNLESLVQRELSLAPLCSYPTLVRFMKAEGLRRSQRTGNDTRPGLARARARLEQREVRSFEVEHVGGLWHLDFDTSRHIGILHNGQWIRPHLLGIMDDRSRLCCHAQFYVGQSTEVLVHGFVQALLKRGLPRALLTDNGGEMTSAKFVQGLERLSINHETTFVYSPYQNGNQEKFWGVAEGRFLAMLDGVADLTLDRLNLLLQAWVEQDYH